MTVWNCAVCVTDLECDDVSEGVRKGMREEVVIDATSSDKKTWRIS